MAHVPAMPPGSTPIRRGTSGASRSRGKRHDRGSAATASPRVRTCPWRTSADYRGVRGPLDVHPSPFLIPHLDLDVARLHRLINRPRDHLLYGVSLLHPARRL